MTFDPRRLAPLGVALALLTGASAALAGASYSSVLITPFSYSTTGGTLLWSDPYQSFSTTALDAGGLLASKTDGFDTGDYFFAIAGASTANSNAAASTTTPQTFWATASTVSSIGALSNAPNQAKSSVGQSGSFSLSGAGSVTFNVGYKLDATSPGGNASLDYGSALLAFDAVDSDNSSGGSVSDSLMSFAQASGTASRSGIFTMTVNLTSGETGFYNLQGNALAYSTAAIAAAVPEPTQWMLLLAGMASTAVWVRSRRQPREL